MQLEPLELDSVFLMKPRRFEDERGVFFETYRRAVFAEHGLDLDFIQDNFSRSTHPGTVRGLHFQTPPHAQAKLVRCVRGAIRDVAVDLRAGSPTFGRHVAVELSADNGHALFVPAGFAHGFATLEPDCEVAYKVDAYYAPDHDAGLIWNDPALGIDWGVDDADAVLSPKDRALPGWADFETPFSFSEAVNHA